MLHRIVDAKQKLEEALKNEAQEKQAVSDKLRKVWVSFTIAKCDLYDFAVLTLC